MATTSSKTVCNKTQVCPEEALLNAEALLPHDKPKKGSKVATLVHAINAKVQEQSSPTRSKPIMIKRTSSTGRIAAHSTEDIFTDKGHSLTLKPRSIHDVPNGFSSEESDDNFEREYNTRHMTRSLGRNEFLSSKAASCTRQRLAETNRKSKSSVESSSDDTCTSLLRINCYQEVDSSLSHSPFKSSVKEIPKGKVESNPFFQRDRKRIDMKRTPSPTKPTEISTVSSNASVQYTPSGCLSSRSRSTNEPMTIKMRIQLWSEKEKEAKRQEVIERRKSAHFPVNSSAINECETNHPLSASDSSNLTSTSQSISTKQRSSSMSSLHTEAQKDMKDLPTNISRGSGATSIDLLSVESTPLVVSISESKSPDHCVNEIAKVDHGDSSPQSSPKGSPKRNSKYGLKDISIGSFSKIGTKLLSPRFRRKKHNSCSQEDEEKSIKIANRSSKKRKAFKSKLAVDSSSQTNVEVPKPVHDNFIKNESLEDDVFTLEENSCQKMNSSSNYTMTVDARECTESQQLSSTTASNVLTLIPINSDLDDDDLHLKEYSEEKLEPKHNEMPLGDLRSESGYQQPQAKICTNIRVLLEDAGNSEVKISNPRDSDDSTSDEGPIQNSLDMKVSPSRSALKRRASDNAKSSLPSDMATASLRKGSFSPYEDITSVPCLCEKVVFTSDRDTSFDELTSSTNVDKVYRQETMKFLNSTKSKAIEMSAVSNLKPEVHLSDKESVETYKPEMSVVVKPTVRFCQADEIKESVDVGAVMSLCDLEQYDIMLQGLIDELSIMSEEMGSGNLIATPLMCADAVWDRSAQESDDLSFKVGDVIEILDMSDDVWWQGSVNNTVGWFPASFVRLRIGQESDSDETESMAVPQSIINTAQSSENAQNAHALSDSNDEFPSDIDSFTGPLSKVVPTSMKMHGNSVRRRMTIRRKDSTPSLPRKLTPTEVRAKVVEEILNTERDYVHNLEDIVEGYLNRCREYSTLFDAEKVETIFSNIEQIYKFQRDFLRELELKVDRDRMDCSEIGDVFVNNKHEFAVYSQYCNNHPHAVNEMNLLQQNEQYTLFFESCRLLRNLQDISLEGFLLTPVQKICKYPLQLSELLKYTDRSHPDYDQVIAAQQSMKEVAMHINEQKRRMENIGKIGRWQMSIDGWKGPDILEKSTELIYSGELHKISKGHSQERHFFLFDRQLVYCKKEIGGKLSYKGRLDMEECQIADMSEAVHGNTSLKNAWRMHNKSKDKWYIIYAKTSDVKKGWMDAFQQERRRVHEDSDKGFRISMKMKRAAVNLIESSTENIRRRKSFSKKHILFTESVDSGVRHRIDSSSSAKKFAVSGYITSTQATKKQKGNKRKS